MAEEEKRYDLEIEEDRNAIIEQLAEMKVDGTLSFLLSDEPIQMNVGKIGYNANRDRDVDGINLDLSESDQGLVLIATCKLLEESEEDQDQPI